MRIVVKVGTSTLAHSTGRLNIRKVEKLCKILSDIKNADNEVILVSSGAIGMGVGKLNLKERPADMPGKQAAAAVGQCELMYTYDKLFSEYRHTVGQILLTAEDIDHFERKHNFQNTLSRLLELGALPIVNENDTVSTAEMGIGDNDTLASVVAVSCHADLLILLSDIDGLYTKDPHKNPDAELITDIYEITDQVLALAGGAGSSLGTGGMSTKLSAAKRAMSNGIDMVIANGDRPEDLYEIVEGKDCGTRFHAR
jgi:glutamate 5-kinase